LFALNVLLTAAAQKENALEDVALVAGTQQNLSNLYSLDIYGSNFFILKTSSELPSIVLS